MSHVLDRRLLLAALAVGCVGRRSRASGPTFWTVATAAEFLQGHVRRRLRQPATASLTAGPAAHQPADVRAGADLESGRGGRRHALGRHRRRRPRAPPAPGPAPKRRSFDADENNVFASPSSGTRVYAATVARRQGLRDRRRRAGARRSSIPTEKYIWALAVDASGPPLGRRRQSRRHLSRRRRRHRAASSIARRRRTS